MAIKLAYDLLILASVSPAASLATRGNSPCPNQIAGSWTLTSSNVTTNGTTIEALGPNPQGLLINMPAPDYTFSEEINTRPNFTPVIDVPTAQSNVGTYTVDENGVFTGRTTLASTIPGNIGVTETSQIFTLTPVGDTLLEIYTPVEGTVVYVVWTRFVPGSTSI